MDSLTLGLDQVELERLPAFVGAIGHPYQPKRRLHLARAPESGAGVRRRPSYLQLSPTGRSTIPRSVLDGSPSAESFNVGALLAANGHQDGRKPALTGFRMDSGLPLPCIPR